MVHAGGRGPRVSGILAVDSNNLLHRSYHGFRRGGEEGLRSFGVATEAVHGAVASALSCMQRVGADRMVFCFDPPGGCPARKALVPGYKQGRAEASGDLVSQLELAHRVLLAAGIPTMRPEGWEADDAMASVAAQSAQADKVWLLSQDRDVLQLVDDRVRAVLPGSCSEIGPGEVLDRYGVTPSQYPHLAALRGEGSDRISGVRGVGAKTAQTLIERFGSVEGVLDATYEEVEGLVGSRFAKALASDGTSAKVALEAGRLRRDLEVPDIVAVADYDPERVLQAFEGAGLRTLGARIVRMVR